MNNIIHNSDCKLSIDIDILKILLLKRKSKIIITNKMHENECMGKV